MQKRYSCKNGRSARGGSMRKLGVVEFITLDGVMQGLGGPDEDREGGFDLGGWSGPYGDDVLAKHAGQGNGPLGPRPPTMVPSGILSRRRHIDASSAVPMIGMRLASPRASL